MNTQTQLTKSSSRWQRPLLVGAMWLAAMLASTGAQATQPIQQNLTQMIAAADLVVSGSVQALSDGLENGVAFTEVTIKVKGSARRNLETGSEYKFRQWGLLAPKRMANGRYLQPMQIEGMPQYKVGEQVVVFLNPAAGQTGLRSPVGLSQGKFMSVDGRVSNGQDNRGLFDKVQVNATLSPEESQLFKQDGGPVDENTLMNLVTRAVNGRWVETGVMR